MRRNVRILHASMDTRTWRKYWRRALWVTRLLRFVPFVRLVGLNGSMATGSFRKESDIDFFIAVEPGHIFLTRILSTIVIHVTGLRISDRHTAGRICPNRYATTDFLDITAHNQYHARVFHNLLPLYADPSVYKRYVAENSWMEVFGYPVRIHPIVLRPSGFTFLIQQCLEKILGAAWLEIWAENTQRSRIAADTRAKAPGSMVVITSQELRFHLAKPSHEQTSASALPISRQ